MKNKLTLFIVMALVCISGYSFGQRRTTKASYGTALGLRVDFGEGRSLVGPNIKHFFNANSAIDASVLFVDGLTTLEADYQYNAPIAGAPGLKWYVGVGPEILFWKGDTGFAIRPDVGLDFTIPSTPLNLAFDWRPRFLLSPTSDTDAGRFGFGVRYAF